MSDHNVTGTGDQHTSEELKIAQAASPTGDSVILDKPAAGNVERIVLQPGQHITLTFDLDAVELTNEFFSLGASYFEEGAVLLEVQVSEELSFDA